MSPHPDHHKRGILAALRGNFFAGLIVIAPAFLTVWLVWNVINWIDEAVLPFIPARFHPEVLVGWDVPGVGVIVFLVFTILVGYLAKGLIGRTFIGWSENIVERMPIIRSIYNAVKQIAETILARSAPTFDKACLVEYPRKGIWAMAFISTTTRGEVGEQLGKHGDMISVFLPTTPNPTSGFLLFVPRADVIELDMGIEDAAKLIISAGLVYPEVPKIAPLPQTHAKVGKVS